MKHAALVVFATILVPAAQAQVQPHMQADLAPWIYEPYVRQLGLQSYPGGGAGLEDRITAVETLPSGAVLVAGYTYGSLGEAHAGASTTTDLFIARFNARGVRQWVSQVGAITGPNIPTLNGNPSGPGGNAGQFDSASDIAVAPDGSIFVVGNTSGSLGETSAGGGDLLLAKFSASGSLLWLHQLGAETAATITPVPGATQFRDASGGDTGSSIVLQPGGAVFIGGVTTSSLSEQNNSGLHDHMLLRYDASGSLQWVRQMSEMSAGLIGFDWGYYDDPAGIALHPSGQIVLAGTSWGAVGTLIHEKGILVTFDDAGHPLDSTTFGSQIRFNDVVVEASSGRILVAGEYHRINDFEYVVDALAASYDANLNLEWAQVMDATTTTHLGLQDLTMHDAASAVRLDPAGNLILGGITRGSLNEPHAGSVGSFDVFTAKFRGSDGHIVWVSQLGQTTAAALGLDASGDDQVGGLALGPAGTISLGGSTNGNFGETHAGGRDALLLRLDRYGRLR